MTLSLNHLPSRAKNTPRLQESHQSGTPRMIKNRDNDCMFAASCHRTSRPIPQHHTNAGYPLVQRALQYYAEERGFFLDRIPLST